MKFYKNTMSRMLCILCASVMLITSISFPAYADEDDENDEKSQIEASIQAKEEEIKQANEEK